MKSKVFLLLFLCFLCVLCASVVNAFAVTGPYPPGATGLNPPQVDCSTGGQSLTVAQVLLYVAR